MKHIYTCSSKIHGLGVNIGEDAKKGDIISYIKGDLKFKVNKDEKDALDNPDWVGIEKNQWIDPHKPYKFLNHSCNPSAGIKGKVTLVALRNMKEGEEITIDYSTIEGDPLWRMKCACGEPNCRKIIRSVHSLPEKQFKKYLPFVPTYFKKVYEKHRQQTSFKAA
ncbi:MAG TPA: SET domain-containing protein-lysine N-methyltransferase [Candidatus Paceibacterota bacterium]|nr:SET domain-containing protein-lysine N-methyltransferase [Candidatus Paceibacterota bacterium]